MSDKAEVCGQSVVDFPQSTSLWVSTAGEGLSRYNKRTQKWESFNLNDGLADNNIRSIALDGKYVWIGTFSAGVY
ncbi:hypothetical protein HYR99_12470 [Candidatus Poribacteria bacterium]|nr:hypothetical protein [Candidatus Poribacteria bacterium]